MDSTEITWHKAITTCKSEQFICRHYLIVLGYVMFNLNSSVFSKSIVTHEVQSMDVEFMLLSFLRNVYAINILCLQVE